VEKSLNIKELSHWLESLHARFVGVALVADILLFWPGAIVDFATGAIYQPGKGTEAKKADTNKPKIL
jgi:hypothetical protein